MRVATSSSETAIKKLKRCARWSAMARRPRAAAAAAVEVAPAAAAGWRRGGGAGVSPHHDHGHCSGDILLVDDDPDLLKLISLRLASVGYCVRTADSGEAALGAFGGPSGRGDFDLRMPGIDGPSSSRRYTASIRRFLDHSDRA